MNTTYNIQTFIFLSILCDSLPRHFLLPIVVPFVNFDVGQVQLDWEILDLLMFPILISQKLRLKSHHLVLSQAPMFPDPYPSCCKFFCILLITANCNSVNTYIFLTFFASARTFELHQMYVLLKPVLMILVNKNCLCVLRCDYL